MSVIEFRLSKKYMVSTKSPFNKYPYRLQGKKLRSTSEADYIGRGKFGRAD